VFNAPIVESPKNAGPPEPAAPDSETPITKDAIHQVLDSADKLREQVEDDPLVSLRIPSESLPDLPPTATFPEVGEFASSQPSIPVPNFDGSDSAGAHELQYAQLPPAPEEAELAIGRDWNVESTSISTSNPSWGPPPAPSTYSESSSVGLDVSSGAPASTAFGPTARPHGSGPIAADTLPAIPGWKVSVIPPSGVILDGVPRLGPTPAWMMGPPPSTTFPRSSEGYGSLRRLPGAEVFLPPTGQLPMRPLLPTGPPLGSLPSSPRRHQFHFGPSIRPLTSGIPVGPPSFDAAGGSR
jgi:hypothetical protein